MTKVIPTKLDSLIRSYLTLGNDGYFLSAPDFKEDGVVIDDNSRLRHPREGGTTESGICFI
ncbi:hypothetical protein VCR6J2_610078 [Vibrio coralliirubri]|nr:hypothetical protein VCR6J2_610078 [Vibrio coralliirubri]